jgi:tetratricopeptide (TPR) repeat protein
MAEDHHDCNCVKDTNDSKILAGQAEGLLQVALEWLGKTNLEATSTLLDIVKKLLTLSGVTESDAWINYYYARASVAQKRNQLEVALASCRKALDVALRLYSGDHYAILLAQANVGESLAALGQKDEGRAMVAASLEKLKVADVGTDAHMVAWKEKAVGELTQTLKNLS